MARRYGSNRNGGAFPEATRIAVWNKATMVAGVDGRVRRKDACGAWIDWSKYGDTTEMGYGWEIDHIRPVAQGGSDDLSNLQALQWQNNRSKGDNWPNWTCAIVATA